jgi:hypothetical protein
MAASVLTTREGGNLFSYNVRGVFSSADETNTVIIDLSAKTGPLGAAPSKLKIDEVWWAINGFDYVTLSFDRTSDVIVDHFSGQGYMDFKPFGGKIDNGTGGTGDLLLSTIGGEANASYSFIISGRFKQ